MLQLSQLPHPRRLRGNWGCTQRGRALSTWFLADIVDPSTPRPQPLDLVSLVPSMNITADNPISPSQVAFLKQILSEAVTDVREQNNVNLAVFVLYDYLITLDREVRLLWGRKISLGKGVFLLNRYSSLLLFLLSCLELLPVGKGVLCSPHLHVGNVGDIDAHRQGCLLWSTHLRHQFSKRHCHLDCGAARHGPCRRKHLPLLPPSDCPYHRLSTAAQHLAEFNEHWFLPLNVA
ncbi:hypothetical protein C8Q78DRAFT_119285 [Trametes maxima]|nr:hypothetical protein C8Q78DRAFT_119285 [Trametes maxima]